MFLKFEKVIPTKDQIKILYELLINRRYSISHNQLPSSKEHSEFVLKNSYVEWYIVYKNEKLYGSVYIHSDNSIGINFNEIKKEDILEIITYIKNYHKPLPEIKSSRRGEFFLNVAKDDLNFIKILKQLNKIEIQRSFII